MRKRLDTRETKLQQERADFLEGWRWSDIYSCWRKRLDDFNIKLDPLFLPLSVQDPADLNGREVELAWWSADSLQDQHLKCQRHFDRYPGTRGHTHPHADTASSGVRTTLQYLWDHRSDPETVAAIFLNASLFSRLESARKRYPDTWPPIHLVYALPQQLYEQWMEDKPFRAWHYACTNVLPDGSRDYLYKIDSLPALIHYLAEEHASILLKYKLVEINFSTERDPDITRLLETEYEEAELQKAVWQRRRKEQEAEEERKLDELKHKHPRFGEWHTISPQQLEHLVWMKPTSQIAMDFGVSDVAVGKRCKSLGIVKPAVGFWNKVTAGKVPHPQGKRP